MIVIGCTLRASDLLVSVEVFSNYHSIVICCVIYEMLIVTAEKYVTYDII